jgi:hypothetical protein
MSKKNNFKKFQSKSEKSVKSKKSPKKSVSITEKKSTKRPIKDFSEDSFDDPQFEEEIQEKNIIEREIKGEIEAEEDLLTKEDLDKIVNKNINDKTKKAPEKVNMIIKKSRKDTIVDSILDAYNKMNIPEAERMTAAQLKATKINILEKKLAEMTEKLVGKIIVVEAPEKPGQQISDDLATNALFNINIILSNAVENIAETARQNEVSKKYVPNIKGLTARILRPDKEKALKECLKDIIKLHGDKIKPFMSPIYIWLMFMISTASEQVHENFQKNSENPITS